MGCKIIPFEGGGVAIVCSRRGARRCQFPGCNRVHTKLCDYPSGNGTCDFEMCDLHASRVGPNRDYCPKHVSGKFGPT